MICWPWLVGLVADTGRKRLISRMLGTDQERALRPAVEAAVAATAAQLAAPGEQAGQLAMAIGEVFRDAPKVALAGQATLLEALQAGIAARSYDAGCWIRTRGFDWRPRANVAARTKDSGYSRNRAGDTTGPRMAIVSLPRRGRRQGGAATGGGMAGQQ